ncbi:hypothetical protein M9458_058018, partial [Cirrhinus mrigala]
AANGGSAPVQEQKSLAPSNRSKEPCVLLDLLTAAYAPYHFYCCRQGTGRSWQIQRRYTYTSLRRSTEVVV